MLISPAFAWNNPASTASSGGAKALTIILAVGITVLLITYPRGPEEVAQAQAFEAR
jgi:hypothetical protein